MNLLDTHCHLFMDPLERDVAGVLERAHAAGVNQVVVPAYSLASWPAVAALAEQQGVFPAFGLHPLCASQVVTSIGRPDWEPPGPFPDRNTHGALVGADHILSSCTGELKEFRDRLAAEISASQAVAVGEIGLDFSSGHSGQEMQLAILRMQLELAVDLDLPVIVHCRKGWELLVGTLQSFAGRIRGVLHAYMRPPTLARSFFRCGFLVSFGGAIMQSQAKGALRSAAELPLDRIVLETSSLTNDLPGDDAEQIEPQHVRNVAMALAEIRGESLETIAEATTGNSRWIYWKRSNQLGC